VGRYTGSVCKICRREGEKLYLKGERCFSEKCAVAKRPHRPGEHGRDRKRYTEFGIRLQEKQKVRRSYGVMEKQFRKYFEMADQKKGVTGENLLQILESRLDNVLYRMGFAMSRNEARQLIRHGHILVNDRKTDIPSYLVSVDDTIEFKEKSKDNQRVREIKEMSEDKHLPSWIEVDFEKMRGEIIDSPVRDEIDIPIREQFIVEYYSR